jgi:hypothetical protein
MLSMYPDSFNKTYNIKTNVEGLLTMLPNINLDTFQKDLFMTRYIPFVMVLETRQKRYRILHYVSNSIVHSTSILLPGMITFGDLYDTRNQDIKHMFHVLSIIFSLIMSIVANFIILYKINQKFSIYVQYYRTMKHEIWKMITNTGPYEHNDNIFKYFSKTMETYIEELHNFEYEFTLLSSRTEEVSSSKKQEKQYDECDCECEFESHHV